MRITCKMQPVAHRRDWIRSEAQSAELSKPGEAVAHPRGAVGATGIKSGPLLACHFEFLGMPGLMQLQRLPDYALSYLE